MEWTLLAGLEPDVRRSVLAAAQPRRYGKDEIVFHDGDPGDSCHLLAKGHVTVRQTTPFGDNATFAVLGPGSAFGEQALIGAEGLRTATVAALDPVETLIIRRAAFDDLRKANAKVEAALAAMLAATVQRLSRHLVEALYLPVDKRVLRRLVEVAEMYAGPSGPIVVPLTQEDLASMAGTTRPTANRILQDAAERGLVALARGRIEVRDYTGLKTRAS